jgi:hypothetical protein
VGRDEIKNKYQYVISDVSLLEQAVWEGTDGIFTITMKYAA